MSTWPEDSLPGILERYRLYTVAADLPPLPAYRSESHRLTCVAIGPETVGNLDLDLVALASGGHQQLVNAEARAVREAMLRQVEDAIAAALEAGWALGAHPEITVKGTIRHDRETGVDVPCAEVEAVLTFRREARRP